MTAETAFLDGRDALAFVVIRPAQHGNVSIEAAANGMNKKAAAYILRHLADQWDPPNASEVTG